jgi:hypothetical protein
MYNIRDKIIPLGKIKELNNYLENNILLEKRCVTDIIETFYGCAISANNIQIISLLNLFVRENNIKINKSNVIIEIYYADFRAEYDKQMKQYGCRIMLGSFDDKIEEKYKQVIKTTGDRCNRYKKAYDAIKSAKNINEVKQALMVIPIKNNKISGGRKTKHTKKIKKVKKTRKMRKNKKHKGGFTYSSSSRRLSPKIKKNTSIFNSSQKEN